MARDIELGIRLTADGKGLSSTVRLAGKEIHPRMCGEHGAQSESSG